MTYYSTTERDRAFIGPRDCGPPVGVTLRSDGSGGVGLARGHSAIPRNDQTDRPAEVLWKLRLGSEDVPGLWTLRSGVFKLHHPIDEEAELSRGSAGARS